MKTELDIVNWFCSNRGQVASILTEMNTKKSKLLEFEPSVFHDDIIEEFYDLTIQKIATLVTLDLAIPIEMVYNTIQDKKLLVDRLNEDNDV